MTAQRNLRNVTVTLDAPTYAQVRVQAAERHMSLSRFIGEVLRDAQRRSRDYEKAMREALAAKPLPLKGAWKPYPRREELHDRPVLRRR